MLKQDQRFLCDVHLLEHINYSIMAWIRPESLGQTLTLLNRPKMFSRWFYGLLRSKVMRIWRSSLDSNPSLRLFLTTLNRSATRSMVFFQVYFAFVAFLYLDVANVFNADKSINISLGTSGLKKVGKIIFVGQHKRWEENIFKEQNDRKFSLRK